MTFADQFAISSGNLDGAGRYPVVPFDLDGESIYLGAPVHFIIDHLVNTDFVLQEPPKHAFYDNRPQITINGRPQPNPTYGQVVTVSRYDETNVALQTSQGTTFSGKAPTRPTGPSAETANAGGSVAAGFGDVDKVEASVESTARSATTTTRIKTTTTRTTASAPSRRPSRPTTTTNCSAASRPSTSGATESTAFR